MCNSVGIRPPPSYVCILGFTGDRNWNKKGFEFTSKEKAGNPVTLLGRSASARPLLTDDIVNAVSFSSPIWASEGMS